MASVATTVLETAKLPPLQRIVLLESDPATQAELHELFSVNGYAVDVAESWADCKELLRTPVSVLLLDLQAVNIPTAGIYEEIRFVNPGVQIIALGRSSSVLDRVFSLESGADDYVVKPFNGRELLARVNAANRRSHLHITNVFSFSDVCVDFRKMEVRRQGQPLSLTAQLFKVLKFMLQNSDRVLSREELLNQVWGFHCYPTTRTVDNHILKLRQKLEPEPSNPVHFLTIYCVGYKFVPRPEAATLA